MNITIDNTKKVIIRITEQHRPYNLPATKLNYAVEFLNDGYSVIIYTFVYSLN